MSLVNEEIVEKALGCSWDEYIKAEKDRKEHLGNWIIENKIINPIYLELRFLHGGLHVYKFMMFEKGKFEIDIKEFNKTIYLNFIEVFKEHQRQGYGHHYMKVLTDLADKYNYKISLQIEAKFGTGKRILNNFYKKHGFYFKKNSHYKDLMERTPVCNQSQK